MYKEKRRYLAELYTKEKLSMMQIARRLRISASAVRYHLEKGGTQRRSISEAISNLHITKFKKAPFTLRNNLTASEQELKLAGIMLYWGEGAKSGGSVKFVNSDPEVIKIFAKFLRDVCGISESRLKALVHMYPDHNRNTLERFWSRVAHIPPNRFYKAYVHRGRVGTYKKKSAYGTLALNYSDKKLLQTILQWIEDYRKKLID